MFENKLITCVCWHYCATLIIELVGAKLILCSWPPYQWKPRSPHPLPPSPPHSHSNMQSSPFPIVLCLSLFSFLTLISLHSFYIYPTLSHSLSLSTSRFLSFFFLLGTSSFLGPHFLPFILSNPLQHLRTKHRKIKFRKQHSSQQTLDIILSTALSFMIKKVCNERNSDLSSTPWGRIFFSRLWEFNALRET